MLICNSGRLWLQDCVSDHMQISFQPQQPPSTRWVMHDLSSYHSANSLGRSSFPQTTEKKKKVSLEGMSRWVGRWSKSLLQLQLPVVFQESSPAESRNHEAELQFFFSPPLISRRDWKTLLLLVIINHSETKPGLAELTVQSEHWEN